MDIESFVIVTGLADDHEGVREALTAATKLALGPFAVVIEPVVPPAIGFELLVAMPEPVTAAALEKLRHALVLELRRREVMHADLALDLPGETEA